MLRLIAFFNDLSVVRGFGLISLVGLTTTCQTVPQSVSQAVRAAECEQIADVINTNSAHMLAQPGLQHSGEAAKTTALALAALDLNDQQLHDFRTHIASVYHQVQVTGQAMAKLTQQSDRIQRNDQTQPIIERHTQAMNTLSEAITAKHFYCNDWRSPQSELS
ncbi:hypothetical protein IQ266_09570 [filamentous cyanobacterium LEGE 11480]|uniref:Uncharacterized protein n=1 Tax=Romeriopsis navalis LEGE 11480 TaxID=2777977 RepID=A0A928Z2W0_9CYAN|nr:hypothetical protein [Romeriopsis navalis]MBE9029974.1 hypothetical protein [Romeriopsis navalis LEGE 11480]